MTSLEALWEYRLLVANYEDKWSKNTSEHFIKCADIIEKELEAINIIKKYPYLVKIILESVSTYGIDNIKNYDLLKEILL